MYNKDPQRFQVLGPTDDERYNVVISRVNTSDAGIYRCKEIDGRYPGETCTELIVTGKTSIVIILSFLR